MKDALDVEHLPCAGAPRIACLVPSITELLFDLGLGEYVVARTGFCIHPAPQVLAVPKVGGTKDVNVEKLLSLAPTYIIVNIDENRKEVIDQIKQRAPHLHIIVTHPRAPEDNEPLYRLLGTIFQREEIAASLCTQWQAALHHAKAATQSLPRERVLYLIWKDPWMTVGADTYIARTLSTVGWDCAQPDEIAARYPTLFDNNALWKSVRRVLLASEPYAFREKHIEHFAELAPQASAHVIDGEITSWYGSRAISGMLALANFRLACATSPLVTQPARAAN